MRPKLLKVQSENQWFQRAEVLQRNRKKRKQHRQFLVEGVHSLNALVANNAWAIEALLYTPDRRLSYWASAILETAPASPLSATPLSCSPTAHKTPATSAP